MKKTYKLYYGTEESCYECWKVGEYNTLEEAQDAMREHISMEIDYTGLTQAKLEENLAEIMANADSDGVAFENPQGYEMIYIIGTDGRAIRSEMASYRRDYIALNF